MTFGAHVIIPDEWISAYRAARELQAVARREPGHGLRHTVAFLVPFVVGAGLGFAVKGALTGTIVSACLGFVGVLAGFVITLMLFTGRLAGDDTLDYEEMRLYVEKVSYLLWSQVNSLGLYLATSAVAIAWMVARAVQATAVTEYLAVFLFGVLAVAIVRTALLPFQIYELHRFSLEALLRAKEREINEQARRE